MYIDYHITNDKEVVVVNDKGENVKISGVNIEDIKKTILLSNKIEGLEDKIKTQDKIIDDLKFRIGDAKETRNIGIVSTILCTLLTICFITNPVPISFLITASFISVIGLSETILKVIDIKKYNTSKLKITELRNSNLEKNKELKNDYNELITEIKIEKLRNEKKEELVKAYKEGLKNEVDFSIDYDDVKTLKLKGENL